jgi:hypothetical protein
VLRAITCVTRSITTPGYELVYLLDPCSARHKQLHSVGSSTSSPYYVSCMGSRFASGHGQRGDLAFRNTLSRSMALNIAPPSVMKAERMTPSWRSQ